MSGTSSLTSSTVNMSLTHFAELRLYGFERRCIFKIFRRDTRKFGQAAHNWFLWFDEGVKDNFFVEVDNHDMSHSAILEGSTAPNSTESEKETEDDTFCGSPTEWRIPVATHSTSTAKILLSGPASRMNCKHQPTRNATPQIKTQKRKIVALWAAMSQYAP